MLNNSFVHELQTCAQKNPFFLEGKKNIPETKIRKKYFNNFFV